MKKSLLGVLCIGTFLCQSNSIYAQIPTIKFATPAKDSVTTTSTSVTFSGLAQQPIGNLFINNRPVKIYKTGAFAIKIDSLQNGLNTIVARYENKKNTSFQNFIVVKKQPATYIPVNGFDIASIQTYPANLQWAKPGDIVQITVRATPNMQVIWNQTILPEQDSIKEGEPGIYKGVYVFQDRDTGQDIPLRITLLNPNTKQSFSKNQSDPIHVLSRDLAGYTTGKLPYMMYGYGDDRLGGAKMTYLDSLVPFRVTGKIDNNYKVQLSNAQTAYIPTSNFMLTKSEPTPIPTILSGNWRVEPSENGDLINIALECRRPYSSITEVNPSRLLVDIYGTVSNTNWITKLQGLQVIKNIWYEQLPDNVLRVFIDLKSPQQWGYDIHYEGNNLVIFLKKAPKSPEWKDLTIALDAGHGGENLGADGLTGILEKDITLQVTQRLCKKLQSLGATVVMTRTKDTTLSMVERISYLKNKAPDLLVSLHCNSASPFVQGNSTYYRYIGFAPLSEYIHKEMLKLGLEDYGNVGGFNFALSGPTNYVNALNELAFISNPEDEAKLVDPIWQEKMVQATITGIQKFLQANIPSENKISSKRKK
ncbi:MULTISPECIES: N-acetylmuramoyl-L-alanine amidase family protein [Chitinophagaceae]